LVTTTKIEKTKEQEFYYDYTGNRMYMFFDINSNFKRYHVMDDFGNAVMPAIFAWFDNGEFMEHRTMQGIRKFTKELKRRKINDPRP
jgi:hypothetical protein